MEYLNNNSRIIRHILSIPFIWFMVIPLVFLDITLYVYHQVAFYLYGIKHVDRSKYIKIDRHKLEYLNLFEKINCMYCGYANGLLAYAVVIAGETEAYWCGIKHEQNPEFVAPDHHSRFVDYNDKKAFIDKYKK